MLREWKRLNPKSDESIKSISVKFSKFDRFPDRVGPSKADKDGIIWTDELVADLENSRRNAEEKVYHFKVT